MEEPHPLPELQALWSEHVGSLRCLECGGHFEEDALVRTGCLRQDPPDDPKPHSRMIPMLGQYLVLHDRHLECCASVKYIAVSHVWNPAVSDAHVNGRTSSHLSEAQNHLLESLRLLSAGLAHEGERETELWFDYISVPQWEEEIKLPILRIIPDIFHRAKYTLVHLHDVDEWMIYRLQSLTSAERIDAITGICNATWFGRVWTAMEYVRSQDTKIMTKDFRIVQEDVLLEDINRVWNEERARLGSIHALEALAQMGKNLVPWNLGPLREGRMLERLDFGNAFSLLSRRGCRSSRDFFHALAGVVKGKLTEPLKTDYPEKAIIQIATACLRAGDYSPLLMVPRTVSSSFAGFLSGCGYQDALSFGLSTGSGFPDHHADSRFEEDVSTLKLERIGTVTYTFLGGGYRHGHIAPFLSLARVTLFFTGPDVEAFVKTVGPRLYNLRDDVVEAVLSHPDKCAKLSELLQRLHQLPEREFWTDKDYATAEQVARLTGILDTYPGHPMVSPFDFTWEHGATMHGLKPASLMAAKCASCREIFVYRVGFHRPPHKVHGAVAYRITGWQHGMARKDGLGILVKDGEIVGRLIWASRACACRETDMVRISLRDLPLHNPREG